MTKTIFNTGNLKKTALLTSAVAVVVATPIFAFGGMGLRGSQVLPQHQAMQYVGGAYIAPQAQAYYQGYAQPQATYSGQNVVSNHVVMQQGYVAQPGYTAAPVYAASYVRANALPVGNYSLGLRGASRLSGPQTGRNFNIGGVTVKTNVHHTDRMLDWQENTTGKTLTLLTNRATGVLDPNSLYIGAGVKGGLMWQSTSDAGKFPILSRFPFFSDRTDKQAGVFAINNAALSFTSTFGDWTTIYLQPEYSETDFPGDQDEMQLRKAFVVFGNLQKSPLYAAFGRKTIDFGNFDGYNAFTQTESQHYFWAQSDQPVLELGYYNIYNGLKMSVSAMSAGRQLRVAYAGEDNDIGNYVASIEKEFRMNNGRSAFTLGASYLHDTSYRNNWTAHTFQAIQNGTPPTNFIEYRNSAVDAFAEYNSPVWDMMVEYTTTLKPWGAAIPQDANGFVNPAYIIDPAGSPNDIDNISFDQNLEVLTAQVRYKPLLPNGRRLQLAAVGSWGNIGDDFQGVGLGGQTTSWKNNQQHVLSVEYPINDFLEVGAEYVYNKGFIPFVGPQLVSNDNVTAHAVNVGFKARF